MEVDQYTHNEQHPLSLLILGSLQYLGRGWCFNNIEESTGIVKRYIVFLRKFTKFGHSYLYTRFVKYPTNPKEAQTHMVEFIITAINVGV